MKRAWCRAMEEGVVRKGVVTVGVRGTYVWSSRMGSQADPAGGPAHAGQPGDLAVGQYMATRNTLNNLPHGFHPLIEVGCCGKRSSKENAMNLKIPMQPRLLLPWYNLDVQI